jgi:predicted NUDIX family NTP pyrophosphohydrolase
MERMLRPYMIFCSAKRLKELKDKAMAKQSAGILLFRSSHELQILLVHPGGPFWAKKDEGSWSIPKGEYDEAEDALAAAKVDRAAWFSITEAVNKITKGQLPIMQALAKKLSVRILGPSEKLPSGKSQGSPL